MPTPQADEIPDRGGRWNLTAEAFDALLRALDGDRHVAGERYEQLRRKLVKFFEWRGAYAPEDCADDTINRVARRLGDGEAIRDVAHYSSGVARLVWLETSRKQNRSTELDEGAAAPEADEPDEVASLRGSCLDGCLSGLPADHKELILAYFAEEKGAKIDNRKVLAARLGVEINALRIRVCRIRAKLETCVKGCVAKAGRG